MNHRARDLSSSFRRATDVGSAPTAFDGGFDTVAGDHGTVAAVASPPSGSVNLADFPAWWTSSSPVTSFRHGSSPVGTYPPGGFTNFLQSGVGNAKDATTSPIAPSSERTPIGGSNAKDKEPIDVDDSDNGSPLYHRTEKRLNWTKDEDIRLATAWLRNSKDPVDGNDKKADQFWLDVTKEYNNTTESYRKRNRNQLKIRWDHVKKPVTEFHGCWIKTSRVYRSGFSDDQLMDLANKMFASTHTGKDFMLKHIWKVVRDERKWSAYVQQMDKEGEKGATNKRAQVVNLEDSPNIRPMGHKRAKDERYGKKKASDAYSAISEKLDKFIEVNTTARNDREKMSETQQHLANSKVETAKLNDQTAKNNSSVKC